MTDEEMEAIMEKIVDHQMVEVQSYYGKKMPANFGWAMDVGEDTISITTKVYSRPQMILTTTWADGHLHDSWDER